MTTPRSLRAHGAPGRARAPARQVEGRARRRGESLASAEQLGALARRVRDTLRAMAGEIRSGSITADPYYKSARENACLYCDYASACRFAPGEGGDGRRYLEPLKASRGLGNA